ncbi:unnamed protein product [Phytophthora lilii]|uniref:Unnamed protein product n=1 Tax=Phytophthora lilii TaxID=2077276 RepID=A0A9W6XAQ7_9STRA|nr:unnamed protein product [Phytophthora lilii]
MRIHPLRPFENHSFPAADFVLQSSQTAALLDLVIPGYNAGLPPIEATLSNSYKSYPYEHRPPDVLHRGWNRLLPLYPRENVPAFDFRDDCAWSFADPRKDANTPSFQVMSCDVEPLTYTASEIMPLTSFLRPDPTHGESQLEPIPIPVQTRELVTPLEVHRHPKARESRVARGRKLADSKICTVPGCETKQQSNGKCMRHGGGKRCLASGCGNGAQARGLCKRHGGGARCTVQGCDRSSQSGGLCRTHGGGKLCIAPGCKKGAQRNGKCTSHSSRKCAVDGCSNTQHCGGVCRRHGSLKKEAKRKLAKTSM